MFVPYDGESQRFGVPISAQRRYTSQKVNKIKRERAVKLKQRLDFENQIRRLQTPSPSTSESKSSESLSTSDDDGAIKTIASPRALTLIKPRYAGLMPTSTTSNPYRLTDGNDKASEREQDEARSVLITQKLLALSYGDMVFGGLRADPFESYPIKTQEHFPAVISFCKEVVSFGPSYFQFVMQYDVLFEAIITYVLCVMPNQSPQTKMAMMYHYGGALSKIGQQLSAQGLHGDAVIIAIANLAVICV